MTLIAAQDGSIAAAASTVANAHVQKYPEEVLL
jgi:hypothetical protein